MNGFDSESPQVDRAVHGRNGAVLLDQLAIDLKLAADSDVPILISGPAHGTLALARMIVARQDQGEGRLFLRVCDVARGDDVFAAIEAPDMTAATVLLREIHRLSYGEQATLAELLADRHVRRAIPRRRVIVTSTVSLFDRVMQGTFDARLFYRLNLIHVVVPPTPTL